MTIRQLLQDLHKAAATIGADSDVEIHGMMRVVKPVQVKTWTEDVYSSAVIIVNSKLVKKTREDPYVTIRELKAKLKKFEDKQKQNVQYWVKSNLRYKKRGCCSGCREKKPKGYTFAYCESCLEIRREKNKARYQEKKKQTKL